MCVAVFLVSLAPNITKATPPLEWSLQNGRDVGYRPEQDRNVSVSIAPSVGRDYSFATNYNYFYELLQIAAFIRDWQVDDPTSSDYGGMIEAEAGDLANVVQTDNTLEAIITWCRYALVFQDTLTYGDNVRRAWEYCWRYPAWREEGDSGNDYYRNHNCAWGVWAALAYLEAYGDASHAAYADTCATYMVDHPMSFSATNAFQWINPFVTGWMAGNLYMYGEALGNEALIDTAIGMGNKVKIWVEADPGTRLTEERWAMSSGTAVWGVCSSVFKADPQQGAEWVASYGPMVDTFQPWRNAPDDGYDWDNAWNIAYANAQHAMYLLADDAQYAANFQALTDTLLSYDTDDDGGIPATTQDPSTEDMTWISSYLWLMGVHGVASHLPDFDAGVLHLAASTQQPPFHTGDSLHVTCTFSNFGWNDLAMATATLTLVDPSGADWQLDWSWPMDLGENITVAVTWPLLEQGQYQVIASVSSANDGNPENDILVLAVEVLPVVEVTGRLWSSLSGGAIPGRIVAAYIEEGQEPSPYDTCWADPSDGTWSIDLPIGAYLLSVDPRLPYPQHEETLLVGALSTEEIILFDRVADLVIVDDDEGEDLEQYLLDACDSISVLARRWDRAADPVPPVEDLLEFPEVPVLWLTGEATAQALEPAEQDSLLTFLQGGGLLLLSGQGIVEHGVDGVLFQDMFPISFGENSHDHILNLESTDPFCSGYEHIGTAGQGSANNQGSQDILVPATTHPGVELYPFASYGPGHIAGVRFDGLGGRRILLGFGLEGVGLPYDPTGFMPRHVLLSRCLVWLSGSVNSAGDRPPIPRRPLLALSPNPSERLVTVTYKYGDGVSDVLLRIHDCAGRLVMAIKLKGASQRNQTVFDSSRLSTGVYLCSAGSAKPKRLVIMR